MLRAVSDLKGHAIEATDGLIGHIDEVYFDDEKWTIRYFVVNTGSWLDARRVLLSPIALGRPRWGARTLTAQLTREKVRNSPSINLDKPVSRQQEGQFNDYYGWSSYWGGTGLWARWGVPMMMAMPPHPDDRNHVVREGGDPHLRSSGEVIGYHLHATDGKFGHVEDFIVDDESWAIRYMVVDTSNWWFGRKVLISPEWIGSVRWPERLVELAVTKDVVKSSPKWNSDEPITAEYEAALVDHYRDRRNASAGPPPSDPEAEQHAHDH